MTNLDSILKSKDITLPTKVPLVKVMVFPVVMYGCESWTIKEAECLRIDTFEVWCWRRLLRDPWTVRRSNQSILNEITPECSLEGLMLKLIYCFTFRVMLAEVSKCISFSGIPQLRKWQGLDFTQICKVKHNLFKCAKSVPDHQYVKTG